MGENLNNWEFAKALDVFKAKMIDTQQKRVDDAYKIMEDPKYKWDSPEQEKAGQAKLDSYLSWLKFYKEHHEQGMALVRQHENIVSMMAGWYNSWYENISNEGLQESELMSMQAEMLGKIFADMYKELSVLKLDLKPPKY